MLSVEQDECAKVRILTEDRVGLEAMDSVDIKIIRRFVDCSKRWLMVYINGLTEEQRAYVEK